MDWCKSPTHSPTDGVVQEVGFSPGMIENYSIWSICGLYQARSVSLRIPGVQPSDGQNEMSDTPTGQGYGP
jgi:hypothetical protein